jgi:hypothetical protein
LQRAACEQAAFLFSEDSFHRFGDK